MVMFTSIQKISKPFLVKPSSSQSTFVSHQDSSYMVIVQPNSQLPPSYFSFDSLVEAVDFISIIDDYDMDAVQKFLRDYNELVNPSVSSEK